MVPGVEGSSPLSHPIAWGIGTVPSPPALFHLGMSPSGKAQDFDSCIRAFEPRHPSHAGWLCRPALYDSVAQQAEQLPFKQWVRGSNPRWVTKNKITLWGGLVLYSGDSNRGLLARRRGRLATRGGPPAGGRIPAGSPKTRSPFGVVLFCIPGIRLSVRPLFAFIMGNVFPIRLISCLFVVQYRWIERKTQKPKGGTKNECK